MKTRITQLVALGALIMLGGVQNIQAGVVGITPNGTPSGSSGKSDSIMSFTTTGLGGSRISGLSLYGLSNQLQNGATFSITNGTTSQDQSGTFNIGASTTSSTQLDINWTTGTGVLLANKTYTISLGLANVGEFAQINSTGAVYSVQPGISDYWASPTSQHANPCCDSTLLRSHFRSRARNHDSYRFGIGCWCNLRPNQAPPQETHRSKTCPVNACPQYRTKHPAKAGCFYFCVYPTNF